METPCGQRVAVGEHEGAVNRVPNRRSEIVIGEERFERLEDVDRVTVSAERYVMSEPLEQRLVIKEGELFLYTNLEGNVPAAEISPLGLYFRDTRYLSRLEMTVGGRPPVLLSSTAERDFVCSMEFANLQMKGADGRSIPQASVHVRRTRLLADRLYELLRVKNFNPEPVEVSIELAFGADFADMFEVRGTRRRRRGTRLAPKGTSRSITLAYLGLDEALRKTVVSFAQVPARIEGTHAVFHVHLEPRERKVLKFSVEVQGPGTPEAASDGDFNTKLGEVRRDYERWFAESSDIFTDNEQFTAVLRRAERDIRMLLARTRYGRLLMAGVPWFVAPMGRDALLASLETLMLDPRPAIETLQALTKLQGRSDNVFREEEPGKIMHEMRQGELAALKAIPHTPYYGAIDTTPLYLLLLCETVMWTGDLDFFELLREPIDAALRWIDQYGDIDGDGFVEYRRRSRQGLVNQGWRDSHNAIVHADGSIAEGPIALSEVQAYVYYAKRRLAELFGALGDIELSERLQAEAQALKLRFNERFWMEDEQYVAMALDGRKQQVRTIASTAGHCLWSRIVDDEHVSAVAQRLLSPDMFSGWGVRTISKVSASYNPMSYFNGSVWPLDNAIIARALKKLGYTAEANKIATGLFEAALTQEYHRLPEVFCGFTKQAVNKPVSYPMACSPEAGSAGALYMILQEILGIYANAEENILYVHNPVLPSWLNEVDVNHLNVGRSTLSLRFRREGAKTSFSVRDKQGAVRVVVVE
jgi:glycogen debranching enzyme